MFLNHSYIKLSTKTDLYQFYVKMYLIFINVDP